MKFTYFKAEFAAILAGALVIAGAVSATAQQPTQPRNALIRFSDGALFEVPQGWSWDEFNPGGRVILAYDKTAAANRRNPDRLQVSLYDSPPHLVRNWTRVDVDRSQTPPNGAAARWKVGMAGHLYFEGVATIGSMSLYVTASDDFNRAVVEAAFLKIAGSLRAIRPG